jgi:hypothetical protein
MTDTYRNQYSEIFDIEMAGWCHGIERYPGEIFPGLIHVVVKELKPNIRTAIEKGYAFSLLDLSEKFLKSAKYAIEEEEMIFSFLNQLPSPLDLNSEEQQTLTAIIQPAEIKFGKVIERLKKKWKLELQNQKKAA